MFKVTGLFLMLTFLCSSTLLAQTPGIRSYLFDGDSFREGQGAGAILVRDGFLPQVAGEGRSVDDPLPAGTGAVALLCYRESSGGKLRARSRVSPLPGLPVTVRGTVGTLAARSDNAGYLILALPPGTYDLKVLNFSKRVNIEAGKTTLVPLRAGKRMVD